MCCCPGKVCMICSCLILLVILIGLLFGFGVFKNGFHKLKNTVNLNVVNGGCDPYASNPCYYHRNGRPFFAYNAPPPLRF